VQALGEPWRTWDAVISQFLNKLDVSLGWQMWEIIRGEVLFSSRAGFEESFDVVWNRKRQDETAFRAS
jgi:hypothetical protein